MKQFIEPLTRRQHLTVEQAREVFGFLVQGSMEPVEIAALLVALKTKGETRDEIVGAALALRDAAAPFDRPEYPFADACGTGGDGAGTINISTAAAVLCATMGIPIAKHGNRSISSRCGSADVLEQFGVRIDASPSVARRSLDQLGFCFLFAPMYHAGLRHAGPIRQKLGMRTMMNVLGPLVNPARPTYQVMGVYDPSLCRILAEVLGELGCERALVVHGSGLDEIAVHGPTVGALYRDGQVEEWRCSPADAGMKTCSLADLAGGSPEENRDVLCRVLAGDGSPAHAAAVSMNAGAVAWLFGKASSLKQGTEFAMETLSTGRCAQWIGSLAEMSNDTETDS